MRLSAEERTARIKELQRELAELQRQESEDRGFDHDALLAECRKLKIERKEIEAVKLYRHKIGCGLREAHDAVRAL